MEIEKIKALSQEIFESSFNHDGRLDTLTKRELIGRLEDIYEQSIELQEEVGNELCYPVYQIKKPTSKEVVHIISCKKGWSWKEVLKK